LPAARSRTEQWRDCLKRVHERNGALEISVDRSTDGNASAGADVVWRCRLISVNDAHILVEPPAAFGASVLLQPGVKLIGAMTIGQNRWMFHTATLGHREPAPGRPMDRALMLSLPERVERCTRRSFFRISTANLQLARVQCWPLLDPTTVAAPEAANRAEITDLAKAGLQASQPPEADSLPEPTLLPEVGPPFRASLLNVSGGGLGLLVAPEDSAALHSRPYVWIRLDLRPHIPAPVAVTARIAHTHVDSSQHVYAGLAFDFAHHPPHRKFIVELFAQYVEALQLHQGGKGDGRAAA
jgi:hypothetical protein